MMSENDDDAFHYSNLGSASDWLKQTSHVARPIRSTNQIWVVTYHPHGISVGKPVVADNVLKITVDVYKPAAFILWPITNYENVVLQFTIAWLLQFLTTVIPFYDNITKIHVINGISLKAATSKLALEDKQ